MGIKGEGKSSRTPGIFWPVALCLSAFALACPGLFSAEVMHVEVLAALVIAPVLFAARKRPFAVVGFAALASPFMGPVTVWANGQAFVVLIAWSIGCAGIGAPRWPRRIVAVLMLLAALLMLAEMAGRMNERFDSVLLLHALWLAAARWLTPLVVRGVSALRPALRAISGALAVGIGGACVVSTMLWIDGYTQLMRARRVVHDTDGRVLVVNLPETLGMEFGSRTLAAFGPRYWWSRRDDSYADWERRLDAVRLDAGGHAAPGYLNGMVAEYIGAVEPIENVRARLNEYDAIVLLMQHEGRFNARWVGRVQPPRTPTSEGPPITFTPPGSAADASGSARVLVLSSAACRSDDRTARLTLDMIILRTTTPAGVEPFPNASLFRHALDRGRQMYGSDAGPLGGLASLQDLAGERVLDVGYVPLDAASVAPIDAVQFGIYDPNDGQRWAARGADGTTYEADAVRVPVRGLCAPAGSEEAKGERP